MKKLLVFAMAVGLATSGWSQTPQTAQAPLTSSPPTIDGILGAGEWTGTWYDLHGTNHPFEDSAATDETTMTAPDFEVRWSIMHDATNIYIAVEVQDDTRIPGNPDSWGGDCVEIFWDAADTQVFDYPGQQSRIFWNGTDWAADATVPTDWEVNDTGTVWTAEVVFAKSGGLDAAPATDNVLGFDIKFADNDTTGNNREVNWFWNAFDEARENYNNAQAWGDVTLLAAANEPRGGNIIFVSGTAATNDITNIQPILTDAGYTLTRVTWDDGANPPNLTEANAADLVIFSREANSGQFDTNPAVWNSIETPIINLSTYMARNNRLFWVESATINNNLAGDALLNVPTHPIFTGLTIPGNNQVPLVTDVDDFMAPGVTAGNGTILASRADDPTQLWIAYWPAGTEFYTGAGHTATGSRLLMSMFGPSDGGTGNVDGVDNLTAEGRQVFLNAVEWMIYGNIDTGGGGGTEPVGPPLMIDFTQTADPVQTGYEGYFADHEVPATFTSQDYTAFGTTVSVFPTWDGAATPEAMQMIDRDGDDGEDTPDFMRDWIGTDNRQPGNPLTLTITGAPAGTFSWKSYHHDTHDQTGIFTVTVNDASGSSTSGDLDITDGNAGVLALADATTFETTITSDGSPITLVFNHNLDIDPVGEAFFVMNGFEMVMTAGTGGGGGGAPQTTIVANINPPYVDVNDTLVLNAPPGSLYQWFFNGSPISGATDRDFIITAVQLSDAGSYTVTVDGTPVTGAYILEVNPEGTVPVSGLAGLVALMGACGIGGAGMLRRRK